MALSCFGPACTTGCLSEVRADGLCHAAAPGKTLKLFFVDMYKVSKLVVKGTGEVSLIKPCFGEKFFFHFSWDFYFPVTTLIRINAPRCFRVTTKWRMLLDFDQFRAIAKSTVS